MEVAGTDRFDDFQINTRYKDRLFRMLFGTAENKGNMLSLYNALNGTAYDNPDDLTITTLEDVIYVGMKNDVSFLLDDFLTLWEQQSTFNPNMPLRGLMYFGRLYSGYIEQNKLNLYRKTLIKIPTPKYVVLYNGTEEQPANLELRLSDAFLQESPDGAFEWTASMVNINKGKNRELLQNCSVLGDYMTLINRIRENREQGLAVEEAIDHAVQYCIEENILADFLLKNRGEVLNVCLTEFNRELYENDIRAESYALGEQQGIALGKQQGIALGEQQGMQKGLTKTATAMLAKGFAPMVVAECTGLSLEQVMQLVPRS